ncbi:unnamed protein product [Prorocentrum cordatum]|uniref:Protein arginine N-methyltransferase domain-containing protein n=1 Tax=Prorocentrum cordatum TaxID=2364126 RepID=A0ABN9SNF8_9DINO|nr:unnamed protein product [Polarella glacialis]
MGSVTSSSQVFAGRMEDVELPSKVDVIVSEWMGYFLLYENMLEAVLAAKGRFLEEGGSIFPTVVELYVAPFTDAAMHGERRRFWSDVSGVDMSALLPEVLVEFAAEPRIEGLDFEQLVGEPILLWRHDFRGPAPAASPLRIQARASWFCPPGATAHGYAGWFDCHFDASAPAPPCERASAAEGAALAELLASAFHARFERGAAEPGEPAASKRRRSGQPPPGRPGARQASVLSTAPGAARTHWHHTLFFFREPVPPGSAVEAEFARVSGTSGAKGWVWALRVEHQLGAPAGARSGRPRSGSCAPTRARACAPRPCPPRAPGSTTSGGDRSFGRCSARPLLRARRGCGGNVGCAGRLPGGCGQAHGGCRAASVSGAGEPQGGVSPAWPSRTCAPRLARARAQAGGPFRCPRRPGGAVPGRWARLLGQCWRRPRWHLEAPTRRQAAEGGLIRGSSAGQQFGRAGGGRLVFPSGARAAVIRRFGRRDGALDQMLCRASCLEARECQQLAWCNAWTHRAHSFLPPPAADRHQRQAFTLCIAGASLSAVGLTRAGWLQSMRWEVLLCFLPVPPLPPLAFSGGHSHRGGMRVLTTVCARCRRVVFECRPPWKRPALAVDPGTARKTCEWLACLTRDGHLSPFRGQQHMAYMYICRCSLNLRARWERAPRSVARAPPQDAPSPLAPPPLARGLLGIARTCAFSPSSSC